MKEFDVRVKVYSEVLLDTLVHSFQEDAGVADFSLVDFSIMSRPQSESSVEARRMWD